MRLEVGENGRCGGNDFRQPHTTWKRSAWNIDKEDWLTYCSAEIRWIRMWWPSLPGRKRRAEQWPRGCPKSSVRPEFWCSRCGRRWERNPVNMVRTYRWRRSCPPCTRHSSSSIDPMYIINWSVVFNGSMTQPLPTHTDYAPGNSEWIHSDKLRCK